MAVAPVTLSYIKAGKPVNFLRANFLGLWRGDESFQSRVVGG